MHPRYGFQPCPPFNYSSPSGSPSPRSSSSPSLPCNPTPSWPKPTCYSRLSPSEQSGQQLPARPKSYEWTSAESPGTPVLPACRLSDPVPPCAKCSLTKHSSSQPTLSSKHRTSHDSLASACPMNFLTSDQTRNKILKCVAAPSNSALEQVGSSQRANSSPTSKQKKLMKKPAASGTTSGVEQVGHSSPNPPRASVLATAPALSKKQPLTSDTVAATAIKQKVGQSTPQPFQSSRANISPASGIKQSTADTTAKRKMGVSTPHPSHAASPSCGPSCCLNNPPGYKALKFGSKSSQSKQASARLPLRQSVETETQGTYVTSSVL